MIIELVGQKFRGVLRLSRQWPSSIITPMATNVPDGYYLGKNGRLYPAKRKSLLQRMEEDPVQTAADLSGLVGVQHTSNIFGDGFEEIVAPSKTPSGQPPRARYCGYHAGAELLVIIFRGSGKTTKGVWVKDSGKPEPWIFYANIDEDTWNSLKTATSTGDWLRYELDGYSWSDVPGNNKTGLQNVVDSILNS